MGRGGCQLHRVQEKRCCCFICRFCRSLRSPQRTAAQEPGHQGCMGAGVVVVVWGPRRPENALCDRLQANPPELDQAEDLASLVSVNESSVLNTLLHRYQAQLPHTLAGPDLIFLQPQGLMAPSAGKVRGPQGWGGAGPRSFCISGADPPEPLQAWGRRCQHPRLGHCLRTHSYAPAMAPGLSRHPYSPPEGNPRF